jgi:hypothetical protein
VKSHILLDQLEWSSHVSKLEGCPQCKYESITYSADLHYPLIRHLTHKEIDRRTLITNQIAQNVIQAAQGKEGAKMLVVLDEKYCSSIQLARAIVRHQPQVETQK